MSLYRETRSFQLYSFRLRFESSDENRNDDNFEQDEWLWASKLFDKESKFEVADGLFQIISVQLSNFHFHSPLLTFGMKKLAFTIKKKKVAFLERYTFCLLQYVFSSPLLMCVITPIRLSLKYMFVLSRRRNLWGRQKSGKIMLS